MKNDARNLYEGFMPAVCKSSAVKVVNVLILSDFKIIIFQIEKRHIRPLLLYSVFNDFSRHTDEGRWFRLKPCVDMQRRALPKFLFPDAFATDFTLANLPYGVFRHPSGQARIGTALGDRIIDLAELSRAGLLTGKAGLTESTLNSFMGAGRSIWSEVRSDLQNLLSDDGSKSLAHSPDVLASAVQPLEGTELLLPAAIGDYTDFYASEDHASNVGKIFRPDGEPLLPNWKHIPVGYHGRASSVVVSGTGIRRPSGQLKPPGADKPSFGPSKSFDIELEMGAFIGPGNALGDPVSLAEAEDHIFGLVLLNDWSARDIQVWEYVPLGPFLGKNFGTTISPWVVPLEALEPFRLSPPVRRAGDPEALPYLPKFGLTLSQDGVLSYLSNSTI